MNHQKKEVKHYLDIAREMDLCHFSSHSPGVAFWHPNGFKLLDKLKKYIEKEHELHGYLQVKSPNIVGKSLFQKSGHLEKFSHNMFLSDNYAIRPMSCPNHIDIYQAHLKSYQDLPYPLFEFGEVCRNEEDGALQSLFRMRAFCQDDSHVFVKRSDIQEQVGIYLKMAKKIYAELGFKDVEVFVSLRPEKRFGDEALWDEAENYLFEACKQNNLNFEKIEGGGAFYGPKLELHIKDSLNRSWQLGVIQLDFVLPQRFELSYMNSENKPEVPAILHHAVLGSIERFIGILLENYAHKNEMPLWLFPVIGSIVPVSEKYMDYARKIQAELPSFQICNRNVPLGQKIAFLKDKCIPILLIVGEKEEKENMVSFQYGKDKKMIALSELKQYYSVLNRQP